jgi:hypothetical protein
MRPFLVRLSVTASAALAALAIVAPAAGASVLNGCPDAAAIQPFLPWGDQAMYVLAPDGGFEHGGDVWDLQDGATVVSGNESFQVGGEGDSHALALPDGSEATTPPICIGIDSPTLRFFVRNDGDPDASLRVTLIANTVLGPVTATIGQVSGRGSWHPTPVLLLLANLTALPIVNDSSAEIQLRFTPVGSGGDWRIDDTYVDPWKGR